MGKDKLLVKKSKISKNVLPLKNVTSERIPKERQGRTPTTAKAIVESTLAFARVIWYSSTKKATKISINEIELVIAATTMQR